MIRNAHHSQLPETPLTLTTLVTKFGVSVENVVATMESPSNHQGILLPERKNSEVSLPAFLETTMPITSTAIKNTLIRV